ncbi:MAG: hypothetical protein ACXVY5_06090, partial [Gaiellales bacterium]
MRHTSIAPTPLVYAAARRLSPIDPDDHPHTAEAVARLDPRLPALVEVFDLQAQAECFQALWRAAGV